MVLYNPNIPQPTDRLTNSQGDILTNFSELNTIFGINHIPFSVTPNSGRHTMCELLEVGATPGGAPVNEVTLYCGDVGGSRELFFTRDNSSATPIRLTGPAVPSAASNGYTFLSGGLLIQWGQLTQTDSTYQTLTFATNNIAFPNNCFCVFTQPYGTSQVPDGQATVDIRKSSVNSTSFQWVYVTSSSKYTGFYWIAIGN